MAIFKEYSRFYDGLYQQKNYKKEAELIHSLIKKHHGTKTVSHKILDIGCGTGNHAGILAEKGYQVSGIDLSKEMIKLALKKNSHLKNIDFKAASATNFKFNRKFDTIISLFSVLGYVTTNHDLHITFKNIYDHLNKGGLFIFDFWYGPAVLFQKPEYKERNIEFDCYKVFRTSVPTLFENENKVEVNFDLHIQNTTTNKKYHIKEKHVVRYFFYPELCEFLETNGFKVLKFSEWLSSKKPSVETWNSYLVLQKQ